MWAYFIKRQPTYPNCGWATIERGGTTTRLQNRIDPISVQNSWWDDDKRYTSHHARSPVHRIWSLVSGTSWLRSIEGTTSVSFPSTEGFLWQLRVIICPILNHSRGSRLSWLCRNHRCYASSCRCEWTAGKLVQKKPVHRYKLIDYNLIVGVGWWCFIIMIILLLIVLKWTLIIRLTIISTSGWLFSNWWMMAESTC
jgi:hypothetical protein